MRKQDYFIETCKELGIEDIDSYISSGSTVTKNGVFNLFTKIAQIKVKEKNKQDIFKDICYLLKIDLCDTNFFSSGSTISSAGYREVYDTIRQGLEEVKLIEEGKLKPRSAKEFVNEL